MCLEVRVLLVQNAATDSGSQAPVGAEVRSDVEVLDVERVVFDELPARLDLIAHQAS